MTDTINANFDPWLVQMERALDVMSKRQQLLASNVANLDTPHYRTIDIDFNEALKQAMEQEARNLPVRRTGPAHRSARATNSPMQPREVKDLMVRQDGNNVQLDREMMMLAQTRNRYESATAMLRMRLRQLRAVISEGRTG
ncbi:MAG: flagellar basal body rod protein FlgB [Acidobacteriota bacterium]|nr:MAG: flagellar basal body rod protein FlgB [Acidobacteriota bacterium]